MMLGNSFPFVDDSCGDEFFTGIQHWIIDELLCQDDTFFFGDLVYSKFIGEISGMSTINGELNGVMVKLVGRFIFYRD